MNTLNEWPAVRPELIGGNLLDPQYRDGYACGFADALAMLADACDDVATGTITIDEFLVMAATRCGEVGDMLDRSDHSPEECLPISTTI